MMDDNILRFPGFIVSADRKKVFKDGKVYRSTVQMAKDLPQWERWRTLHWYKATHNPPGADYRTLYLSMTDDQLGHCGGSA